VGYWQKPPLGGFCFYDGVRATLNKSNTVDIVACESVCFVVNAGDTPEYRYRFTPRISF
jgi:hypothetical protein